MKKVLVLAHLGLASPRIIGLAKYLSLYGWEATILTPRMSAYQKKMFLFPDCKNIEIIETPQFEMRYGRESPNINTINFCSRIMNSLKYRINKNFINRYIHVPDPQRIWMFHAIREVNRLFEVRNYSALLSSSSPASYHMISAKLKDIYRIPWIADYRDLWTQNHNYLYGSIRRYFERKLERKTLENSDALITVSPQWVQKLKTFHRKSKVNLITNGFDAIDAQLSHSPNDKFIISYTGRIYSNRQDCSKIIVAIDELIQRKLIDKDSIEFRYYGPTKTVIESFIQHNSKLSSVNWISLNDSVTRQQSYEIQRSSNILVLFNWEDVEEKGVVPSKIFEYLGARKPIIATGGFGSDYVEEILLKTRGGYYCKNVREIKDTILRLRGEFNDTESSVTLLENEKIKSYSYEFLSGRLANLLNELTQ